MNQKDKIQKFVRTNPSIEQIVVFVEEEAQARVKEIKEEERVKKEEHFKVFSKQLIKDFPEIDTWRNNENKDFASLCSKIIHASRS